MHEIFFRGYDGALGRFHQVDPMADIAGSDMPYQYAYNNPVLMNDPSGAITREGDWETYRGPGNIPYMDGKFGMFGQALYRYDPSDYGIDMSMYQAGRWVDRAYIDEEDGRLTVTQDVVPLVDKKAQQGDPFGFDREDLSNSYYTVRSDYTRMKHLLAEFLSGEGPERSLFWGSHPLTQGMKNSAVVQQAKEYYAANYKNGGDMRWQHIDFYATDVPFVGSDIEQFVGSARVSIYPRDGYSIFVLDNTTGKYSGSFDTAKDIPRIPGQITPMGNIYQRFIWIEPK